tara:strand:- start:501 stop:734 length:234 start_codon:yes stop_codon:yes gene_type:complete
LIIGSLGGVFLLGMLTKKANSQGVLIGILFSFAIQITINSFKIVHLLLYSATGAISCFIIGYFMSLFFNSKIDSNKN